MIPSSPSSSSSLYLWRAWGIWCRRCVGSKVWSTPWTLPLLTEGPVHQIQFNQSIDFTVSDRFPIKGDNFFFATFLRLTYWRAVYAEVIVHNNNDVNDNGNGNDNWQWNVVDDDHQACELCEEVAEVIGGMESEPRHAVAEDQPGAQHQLGKILNIIQVWNKKCEMRNIFL